MVRRCLSPVTIKKQADSLIVIAEKDVFRQFLIKNGCYNQNSAGFFDCELRKSSTGTAAGKYEGQATQSMCSSYTQRQLRLKKQKSSFQTYRRTIDVPRTGIEPVRPLLATGF